jgi:hypothetical protein
MGSDDKRIAMSQAISLACGNLLCWNRRVIPRRRGTEPHLLRRSSVPAIWDWRIQSEMMLQIRIVKRPPLASAARLELQATFAEPVLVHPAGLAHRGF